MKYKSQITRQKRESTKKQGTEREREGRTFSLSLLKDFSFSAGGSLPPFQTFQLLLITCSTRFELSCKTNKADRTQKTKPPVRNAHSGEINKFSRFGNARRSGATGTCENQARRHVDNRGLRPRKLAVCACSTVRVQTAGDAPRAEQREWLSRAKKFPKRCPVCTLFGLIGCGHGKTVSPS